MASTAIRSATAVTVAVFSLVNTLASVRRVTRTPRQHRQPLEVLLHHVGITSRNGGLYVIAAFQDSAALSDLFSCITAFVSDGIGKHSVTSKVRRRGV